MVDEEPDRFAVLVLSLWHEDDSRMPLRVRITRREQQRNETVVVSTEGEVLEVVLSWLNGMRQ